MAQSAKIRARMGGGVMVAQAKTQNTFDTLKLYRGAWLVNQVDIQKWGTEVIIHATYDPSSDTNTDFRLVFQNCRTFYWEIIPEEYNEHDMAADVIGMNINHEQEYDEAVISTDLFEIGITYSELILEINW